MIVKLTQPELLIAGSVAIQRVTNAAMYARQHRHGEAGYSLDMHWLGCLGELAVAKAYNKFWTGDVGDLGAKDVDQWQVRATRRANGHLLLHPEDCDDDRFFFVVVDGAVCDIRGWTFGYAGKVPRFWKNDDPARGIRKAYFVPLTVLKPVVVPMQSAGMHAHA